MIPHIIKVIFPSLKPQTTYIKVCFWSIVGRDFAGPHRIVDMIVNKLHREVFADPARIPDSFDPAARAKQNRKLLPGYYSKPVMPL